MFADVNARRLRPILSKRISITASKSRMRAHDSPSPLPFRKNRDSHLGTGFSLKGRRGKIRHVPDLASSSKATVLNWQPMRDLQVRHPRRVPRRACQQRSGQELINLRLERAPTIFKPPRQLSWCCFIVGVALWGLPFLLRFHGPTVRLDARSSDLGQCPEQACRRTYLGPRRMGSGPLWSRHMMMIGIVMAGAALVGLG